MNQEARASQVTNNGESGDGQFYFFIKELFMENFDLT